MGFHPNSRDYISPGNELTMESWYRQFLAGTAAAIFIVTPLELLLLDHTGSIVQFAPFIACAAGLTAAVLAFRGPRSNSVAQVCRWIAYAIILVSMYGMLEHVLHNLELEREVRPDAPTGTMLWQSIFGAAPLLASGILSLGALLIWASLKQPVSRPT